MNLRREWHKGVKRKELVLLEVISRIYGSNIQFLRHGYTILFVF